MGLGDIVGCQAAGLWTKTQDSESWEKGEGKQQVQG